MGKRLTQEEFITRANVVHHNKYNYDNVIYVNNRTPVIITCPIHGDFPQRSDHHLTGCGCTECKKRKISIDKTLSTKDFIKKAKEVHGNKYNYDKTKYINSTKKVTITCPCHGDFEMLPGNHTSMKQGCPDCAKEKLSKSHISNKEEFIAKARAVHGDRYNYGKVVYNGDREMVTITCSKHGDFPQAPNKHKLGQGCPYCNSSHLEEQTRLLLVQNNIMLETQKKFPWLKNKRKMPLDFYLPEYNIAIECQGIQHYLTEGNGHFTAESIKATQENDRLKYKLCKDHGIPIYYIKYDENVNERLTEILTKASSILP